MRWFPIAQVAASKAAHALLDGGSLRLYAGQQPVAELRFSNPALRGDSLGPLAPDEACEGAGTLDGATAFSAGGEPICELTVGLVGSGSDVELKGLDVTRGSRIEVEHVKVALPHSERRD